MKKQIVVLVVFLLGLVPFSLSQTSSSSIASMGVKLRLISTVSNGDFVSQVMKRDPWDLGVFFDGGFGTSGETSDHFLSAGVRIGKVLTGAAGPGILRGQFENAVDFILGESRRKRLTRLDQQLPSVTTGGTYTGLSMTPVNSSLEPGSLEARDAVAARRRRPDLDSP